MWSWTRSCCCYFSNFSKRSLIQRSFFTSFTYGKLKRTTGNTTSPQTGSPSSYVGAGQPSFPHPAFHNTLRWWMDFLFSHLDKGIQTIPRKCTSEWSPKCIYKNILLMFACEIRLLLWIKAVYKVRMRRHSQYRRHKVSWCHPCSGFSIPDRDEPTNARP